MKILILILGLFPLVSQAAVECIGPAKAGKFIVYLHGMDTEPPSPRELVNRKILTKLSKKLNIRFAIPRAKNPCPTNSSQLCWTWGPKTAKELEPVKEIIVESAKECFASESYSVLGFSNGGVAVSSFLRLCDKVPFESAIAVAPVSGWHPTDPISLRGCGPKITAMVGTEDKENQKTIRSLISRLSSLNGPITLVEYEGGHELTYEALYNQLK